MKKVKKIFFAVCFVLILCFNSVTAFAAEEYSWYIKRCGNEIPKFPPHANELAEYDAYFVDRDAYDNGEKIIYLTFDVGYENGNLERTLDVLKEKDVPAAFFVLDNVITKNTELINRMDEEGHLVCNHTKRHKNLCSATPEEIERDLGELESLCYEIAGVQMSKYFRFPEGKYSIEALESVKNLGYKTIFWSFGYDDWDNARQPDKEKSKKKIIENTHDGAVFLFHPTSKTNADILGDLIDTWRSLGYTFGTLDDLCI